MFKVLVDFVDLQDGSFEYHAGDVYPRQGADVNPARIKSLLSGKNRRRIPLIVEVEEKPKPEEKPKRATKK